MAYLLWLLFFCCDLPSKEAKITGKNTGLYEAQLIQ
jgi:hypothetical protein